MATTLPVARPANAGATGAGGRGTLRERILLAADKVGCKTEAQEWMDG
jgi:hypothetical protein